MEQADKIAKGQNLHLDLSDQLITTTELHNNLLAAQSGITASEIAKRVVNLERDFKTFYEVNKLSDAELLEYKGILQSLVDWRFAAMELFPGNGDMIHSMVAAEPLYIADWFESIIEDVSGQFNSFYAERKLMKYVVRDFNFKNLPYNAFGIVYSLHWTKFEDLNNLTRLADKVWPKLLPGGVYLFNYNPLDQWYGARDYYNNVYNGADTDQLVTNLKNIGYHIEKVNRQVTHNYILCTKPGELPNYKLEPILARIIEKSEPFV